MQSSCCASGIGGQLRDLLKHASGHVYHAYEAKGDVCHCFSQLNLSSATMECLESVWTALRQAIESYDIKSKNEAQAMLENSQGSFYYIHRFLCIAEIVHGQRVHSPAMREALLMPMQIKVLFENVSCVRNALRYVCVLLYRYCSSMDLHLLCSKWRGQSLNTPNPTSCNERASW